MFKVENTNSGVKAFLGGFSAEDLRTKVSECQDGNCSCDCDPAMMQKITSIEVESEQNGATITIKGDVNAAVIEPMMRGCLL
ncbi:MAG: hypothetical protein IE916_07650 [Epsilonproteobacteria bacterium]|nr:hypothetical protein [Campylobacterota bacterium]